FPVVERARAHGIVWMASRVGGAISPLLVLPIQRAYGWRMPFFVFGAAGVGWAAVWYAWYRDRPSEKPGVTRAEMDEIGSAPAGAHHSLPWGTALRSVNLWTLMLMYFTYCYGSFFFLSWLQTYLVKGRGFTDSNLWLSTLPFIFGGTANLVGGIASDRLVRKYGLKRGRRTVGFLGLGASALFTVATVLTADKYIALVFLALSYAGSDFMLPTAWAVCLDIGKKYAGTVTGVMNTAGQIGSFLGSVLFGRIVAMTNSYEAPLIPMAAMLAISAALWLKIDPAEELIPERSAAD
ncbi:MAG: MFS transporter, partial [Bryobacteraceae bacterium]